MKKMRKLLLGSALTLCACGMFAGNAAAPAAVEEDFACTYRAAVAGVESVYGAKEVHTYSAEEATAKGIPAGFENEVLEVVTLSGGHSCGIWLDFTAEKVPFCLLDSLQFRVYIPSNPANTGGKPQVRISDPNVSSEWIYQPKETPTPTDTWTTVVVSETTATSATAFAKLEKDGYLGTCDLVLRSNTMIPFYVDSIRYVLKENDGVAPTLQCDDATLELGSALPANFASAYDAQEKRNVAVEYAWESGVVLNANGTPQAEGTYALTVKATDYYGNVSQKTVSVKVVESDNESPVISVASDVIKTVVGAKPVLKATATDNSGSVTVKTAWSAGALDNRGRLTAGEHTWTVTATDVFGNVATKTVSVIVSSDEPAYDYVINEEKEAVKHTVTFDGKDAVEINDGFILDQPADPVKETTAAADYTFLGWYYGETEWDFSKPITEDMDIVSKWDVTTRIYRVTFYGGSSIKVNYGELIPTDAIPANPTKNAEGKYEYVFDGWYNGDVKWDFATDTVAGNMVLTAKFIEVERVFTVTFDGENATEYKYGEKIAEPATPEKEGYTFLGWYNGDKKWNFASNTVKDNMALVSKWKENATEDVKDTDKDSEEAEESSEGVQSLLAGCTGTVGILGGTLAIGLAAVALLKKKED